MRLDLHVHTVASDGAWTPEEVVDGAAHGRLDVIAIADHDTTEAVGPATRAAAGRNLQVVPATELSSTREGQEIHVLGYFVDPTHPRLEAYEERARRLRLERMEEIVSRLGRQGIEVEMSAVLEEAGPRRSMIGRPHLARALVAAEHVESVPEAFDRFIGDQHAAFVPTELGDPVDAVSVIREAGGIPVWAHPPLALLDGLLPVLVRSGLRGLEVYRPWADADQVRRLKTAARTAGLLVSGGSDWHDPDRNRPLGDFFVTSGEVGALLAEGGL